MYELKPCPHCGGTARLVGYVDKDYDAVRWQVECVICEEYSCVNYDNNPLDSAIRWNRRADDEESQKAYYKYMDEKNGELCH